MSTSLKTVAKSLCLLVVAAATLLTSACGSSSSHSSQSTRSATASGDKSAAKPSGAHAKAHPDPVTTGVATQRALPGTGVAQLNGDNRGHAANGGQPNAAWDPCTLVSKERAQAILGRPISTPVQAPLGPTCIYKPAGASFITVTVEAINFATIRPRIRNRKQIDVNGHTAYCGAYGQVATFVPLANGQVLAIGAPCAVGVRFAAVALPRLEV